MNSRGEWKRTGINWSEKEVCKEWTGLIVCGPPELGQLS